ncbi:hypothetical protein [Methanobrevibacter cuticularis]|nr:hypothetical protein [Methanobrevibacter cuticularis]
MKEDIFQQYLSRKTIGEQRIKDTASHLMRYCNIQKMTLTDLYEEADYEEEQKIREKHKKLTSRLETIRTELQKRGYATSVIQQTFSTIKTFYRTMRIEIPYVPSIPLPQIQKDYDDIPHKNHIQQALDTTNNKLHKALILFMFSSCSAMAETLSLTCQSFVDATKEYHDEKEITDVIEELGVKKDIVPFFTMYRQKRSRSYSGGYKYKTCCTPEATQAIIKYLKNRLNKEKILKNTDKLFNIGVAGVESAFERINDHKDNNWGKVANTRFFHPHAMRTAGCTAIENEADGDMFAGRKRSNIHETYFKKKPWRIKEIYLKYIPDLTIEDTEVNILNDEGTKKLQQIENEKQALEQRVVALENDNKTIEDLKKQTLQMQKIIQDMQK